MSIFKIGGKINKKQKILIETSGLLAILLIWFLITYPHKRLIIQFSSENAYYPVYKWTGPDNQSEFKGDNMLDNVKAGEYEFEMTDSNFCRIKGKITIPDNLQKSFEKHFTNNCANEFGEVGVYVNVKIVEDGLISKAILPTPASVLASYKDLYKDDNVIGETLYSLYINILGYTEAIIISIILGFLIGLIPFFRSLMSRWVNAVRFVPLTAVTGLFIVWFGIETNMKVQFLAFGIFVYLLPVVVQRIDEIDKIYLQTAYTLGASSWQQIRHIYWPYVASRIIDDIRVLTAISWTYIIIAEMMNQTGGIGALIHLSGRQSRMDKVFALLIIIVLIGIIQDRIFVWLDKKLFPHKKQDD